MPQNIYDRPDFFAGYSRLPRSVQGLAAVTEWPALRALLPPDLHGRRVADLGCGFGWFCRWAREQGAAEVLGLDLSENMLAQARAATDPPDPGITYARADLDRLELPADGFDLVHSALVLHYIEDLARLFATVHRALVPGGQFVFSMEHPIYTAPTRPGWATDATGRKVWPLDRYLVEGPRTVDWLAKGVEKQHRTMGTLLTLLVRAGFTIRHVEDFCPTAEQLAARPELRDEVHRPMFLLVGTQR